MNAAELKAALDSVGQDHELVLAKVDALRQTVRCLVEPEAVNRSRILARLRDLNEYFAGRFAEHLEEEEKSLFPLLEKYRPEFAGLVARLRLEHEEIRRKVEDLGQGLHDAVEQKDGVTPAVLWDLLGCGWDLWELLDRHASAESGAVRQCLARPDGGREAVSIDTRAGDR